MRNSMDDFKLYAILNTETNKFVTDLTNPRHKFWTSKKRAMSALNTANALQLFRLGKYKRENLKIITINCTCEQE